MKKILFLIVAFLFVNVTFSQNFEKKIASSDKSISDPKKKTNPKTWITRGDLYMEIAQYPIKNVKIGTTPYTDLMMLDKPTSDNIEIVKRKM